MAAPQLRPSAGFCVQTQSASSSSGGRWYLNMCKHKLCEMPIAYSGKPVSKDWILANGIGNMQVPFDIGSFRKLKERAEGAKTTTYCIDVIFNPLLVQLFMDDDFCKKVENFRPFVINLALKRIDESIGVRLSADKVKLVKTHRYKDGEGADGSIPRELADLPGNADCFDDEVPQQSSTADVAAQEPLIQDVTPGVKKAAVKKGFLNSSKAKGSLYGDNGSGEGVLPENAGDPLGYLPKKLRNTCKIVDCNNPEYQEKEKQKKAVDEHNQMNQEFRDELTKDMEKWCKMAQPDKWEEDLPDGAEPAPVKKYDVDYSRFNEVEDVADEPAPAEDRDWYFDSSGVRRRIEKPSGARAAPAESAGSSAPAVKKGFLDDAKKPLYPRGSEQAKAPPSEEQLMKELLAEKAAHDRATGSSSPPQAPSGVASVGAKAAELKVPEFELKESPDGLLLAVSVPGLESMRDVELDVTASRASLAFPPRSGLKPLQVELPCVVLPTKARAKFAKKTRHINITLPVATP